MQQDRADRHHHDCSALHQQAGICIPKVYPCQHGCSRSGPAHSNANLCSQRKLQQRGKEPRRPIGHAKFRDSAGHDKANLGGGVRLKTERFRRSFPVISLFLVRTSGDPPQINQNKSIDLKLFANARCNQGSGRCLKSRKSLGRWIGSIPNSKISSSGD